MNKLDIKAIIVGLLIAVILLFISIPISFPVIDLVLVEAENATLEQMLDISFTSPIMILFLLMLTILWNFVPAYFTGWIAKKNFLLHGVIIGLLINIYLFLASTNLWDKHIGFLIATFIKC